MAIPVEYQVLIGTAVGGLLITAYRFLKTQSLKDPEESQKISIIAIILGVLIIIPFLGVIGLAIALVALKKKKRKILPIIAFVINLIATLLWLAVIIFGP